MADKSSSQSNDVAAANNFDDDSPRPFRRERNLSNRNFAKRGSRRLISTAAAADTPSSSSVETITPTKPPTPTLSSRSSSSSSLQISYSVNSDTENAFNRRSLLKMLPPSQAQSDDVAPATPDPALLDVKQKVERFETLQIEERFTLNTKSKLRTRMIKVSSEGQPNLSPLRVLPVLNRVLRFDSNEAQNSNNNAAATAAATPTPKTYSSSSSFHTSIDEVRSEDEVDDISEEDEGERGNEYVLPEEAEELQEHTVPSALPGFNDNDSGVVAHAHEFGMDDFGKVETVRRSGMTTTTQAPMQINAMKNISLPNTPQPSIKRDFKRNYRTTPRPKTEVVCTANHPVIGKFNSLPHGSKDDSSSLSEYNANEHEDEPELRDKSVKVIQPILEELIKTEETYVENLFSGIQNYGNIFQRRDLPVGLRGKKYVLFGNVEQLAEFHRDEFLPMLQRNRHNLKRLFDEFQHFIDQHSFYGYVIFTMNKQRSLKLCDVYKNYFKLIQTELDDKLGINSFLVQPIQRMARYPLLMQQFITTLFKNREFVMKPLIESCCRLEKKLRTLLTTTNESEVINDIVDCNEFNVFYQGKFRKVSDFQIFDHTHKRTYRGKVFIFDKCIIYTEIKGKSLVFHGRYPCEHVGIVAKTKNFTLFYERRKQQECDFHADPILIEQWLELIRDMVNTYVTEEKQKLQERYSRENDHLHRKPPSLSLFRDSNRFSSDSGIGNIWVMPKPEANEEIVSNRTTWYAT